MHIVKNIFLLIAILMFVAVLSLPYGYYLFLRVATFIGLSFSVYKIYNKDGFSDQLFGIFLIIFVFNPIFPLSLNKELWTIINIISGIYLIYYSNLMKNSTKK